jgi:hypothetical protein
MTSSNQTSEVQNPSSVHPLETSVQNPVPSSYQAFRIQSQPDEWVAAGRLYSLIDHATGKSYSERLRYCSVSAWFVRNRETGKVRVASRKCHLRWCPICGVSRAGVIRHSVSKWFEHVRGAKFMTLTLRHSNAPLPHQIRTLYSSFRKLRSAGAFRKKCRGGVWFFQITYNSESQQWHPHLHCCIDSDFLEQSWLSKRWEKITHGSTIVDIRSAGSKEEVADYVSRYASRPCRLSDIPCGFHQELYVTFGGRRLCGSWGSASKLQLSLKAGQIEDKWTQIGDWRTVAALFDSSRIARDIYNAWRENRPILPDVSLASYEIALSRKMDKLIDNLQLNNFQFPVVDDYG